MLGAMKAKNSWIWQASGKHPIAADYFRLGTEDPLLQAIDEWVDAGFRQWATSRQDRLANHSWRFWARGPGKKILICGISRDSSDRIGRIYPLMLMGAGPLAGWESNWDLLPYALENTWRQLEQLSTKRVLGMSHLEEGLGTISTPPDNWTELRLQHRLVSDPEADWTQYLQPLQNLVGQLSWQAEGVVSLINGPYEAQQQQLALAHRLLKERSKTVPNAVFIGGVPEKTCLALFRRPLRVEDFTSLWSV
jgi:type VI secretion system ImpM family protein